MFGMVFANPLLWAGVFAAGLPVLIHLMTRSTPVIHMFPTLRFLQRARANQSRLFRIRHWLMLALRTAAILLIVLAFLRPEYRAGALVASPEEGA
ncbi:MAG: BatA domain-containing protein, partial [Candidatus Hydrogenedentales bacterium]